MIMTQFVVSMAMVLVNLIIIPTENSRILKILPVRIIFSLQLFLFLCQIFACLWSCQCYFADRNNSYTVIFHICKKIFFKILT